ncbi:hypothetical protein HMSSN139_44990 [Paenibacillus sp. HMSSN-139]|nr:hypothetical protein HMSSN139_44990 [Paenibacillus sp. HMSSN-139]
MTEELGYEKFAAAGGDVGSGVTRYLAANHPQLLYGIHLSDIGILRGLMNSTDEAELSEEERRYKQAASAWVAQEGGICPFNRRAPKR